MDAREAFAEQLKVQREQRAGMQEILSELRQRVLESGVDPHLLREFELGAIDLALQDALERTMKERLDNLDSALADDESS